MSDAIYKTVDVVGSSTESIEDAVSGAIAKASKTIDHIGWFEVGEIRGHVTDGKVAHYQVGMKIGFRLD
ncbi:dodecin flavoprotein [Leisingera sp. ANG-M1]|uniref:dodecin n=1 Tax=Leisingera sp. ANG-M1 TaxID=1577895 RepID=UPI0005808DF8|nr:dodecin [Leisingera sp. ANG-M1]KIC09223.1 dodecin flavoprotein [Leisingera sp. ANG-M1]